MVVADITYVATCQGWAYLSLLTDAGSRAIVGYALCKTLEPNVSDTNLGVTFSRSG